MTQRRNRRAQAGWLTAAMVTISFVVMTPAFAEPARPADQNPCEVSQTPVRNDINGDGLSDDVIGVGGTDQVEMHYRYVGSIVYNSTVSHPAPGGALLYGWLDADHCADVVVGTPSTDQPGQVTIYYDPIGLHAVRALTITAPDGTDGDDFGAALSLGGDGMLVGAPGHAVTGQAAAGVVYDYHFAADGTPTLIQEMTENRSYIPGSALAGDRFGGVLSGNLVGMPGKSVGGQAGAGQVDDLEFDHSSGLLIASQAYTQTSPGVAGAATAGNNFGASLATNDNWDVVGIPGAAVGAARGAGQVQTFTDNSTQVAPLTAGPAFTQDSPGVPGTAETGDGFGTKVETVYGLCYQTISIAVSSPGEDLGPAVNDGDVTVIPVQGEVSPPTKNCPIALLYPGHGLPGELQSNADIGAALSARLDYYDDEDLTRDDLLIGAPGTNVAGIVGAGVVYDDTQPLTLSIGSFANSHYGSVLPTV